MAEEVEHPPNNYRVHSSNPSNTHTHTHTPQAFKTKVLEMIIKPMKQSLNLFRKEI
jgi:hypothetical protein